MRTHKFMPNEVLTPDEKEEEEIVGTAEYASPEMLNKTVTNNKSTDLWALGCIIYNCFHGRTPFKGINDAQTISKIKQHVFTINPDTPDEFDAIFLNFLYTSRFPF